MTKETSEGTEARGRGRLVFVTRIWDYDKIRGLHEREVEVPAFAALGACVVALIVVRMLGVVL